MNWIKKNKKKFWFALLINGALLLLLLLIFRPKYETNDDMGILCMVSGVKLGADAHLVYINYVLGKLLAWCYQAAGSVPWYAMVQYGALLMAFAAITYVCLNKIESRNVIWILAALLTAFSYEAYIRIQYTKTAGILSAAGLFLFCYAVVSEEKYKQRLLGSILLCALGFMYRNVQFFAEAALMSVAGIPVLFSWQDVRFWQWCLAACSQQINWHTAWKYGRIIWHIILPVQNCMIMVSRTTNPIKRLTMHYKLMKMHSSSISSGIMEIRRKCPQK